MVILNETGLTVSILTILSDLVFIVGIINIISHMDGCMVGCSMVS